MQLQKETSLEKLTTLHPNQKKLGLKKPQLLKLKMLLRNKKKCYPI
jgi:hypothetical protein